MTRPMLKVCFVLSLLVVFGLVVPGVNAQSSSSNKSLVAAGGSSVTLATAFGPTPAVITILNAPNAIKTSSVGAISASLSMECALWTYTPVSATSGSGKSIVTSHAGVQVWVEIDGVPAVPGTVVYCDRLQAVGLQIDSACSCSSGTSCSCTVKDTVSLDLFQATKNANSFNFFLGPLSPIVHSVVAKAQGFVQCTSNGDEIPCPSAVLNNYADAKTGFAIGKRVILLEEQNNFGVAP